MKWSLILLLGVGAFVYYRLEINPLPEEEDEAMRRGAAAIAPAARPPPAVRPRAVARGVIREGAFDVASRRWL